MLIFWFLVGTIIGSFLNVCIYRLPRGESLLFPSSHCPACAGKLAWIDLVPIISFVFLRGRCRFCGQGFTWRYPLVEFLTGALFVALWLSNGGGLLPFVFQAALAAFLVVLFFVDYENQLIPDQLLLVGLLIGLAYNFYFASLHSGLIGGGVCFGVLWLIGAGGSRVFQREAMGEGDPLAAGVIGFFLGAPLGLLAIFLGFILAALSVLPLLIFRRIKWGMAVPFASALALGALLALFWGEKMIVWYWQGIGL